MSDVEQLSAEWFKQRCGKATASRISDIVAKTKTGYSTSRANRNHHMEKVESLLSYLIPGHMI